LKQRFAEDGGAGVTKIVLLEKVFYKKNTFERRKGSCLKKWCVEEYVLQQWAFRYGGARLTEAVLS